MKAKYSEDVDILMLELSRKPIDYAEKRSNAVFHYSPDKELVLVELFDASSIFKDLLKEAKRVMPEEVREHINRQHRPQIQKIRKSAYNSLDEVRHKLDTCK